MRNVIKPLLFGLVGILANCAPIRRATIRDQSDESINHLERHVDESLYDFGKRVCKQVEEGHHHLISYYVGCEENGGITIMSFKDPQEKAVFDFPEPTKLTPDNFADYITGKKIILFGEDHSEEEREDAKTFVDYILQLRKAGFTYIGLEIDYRHQEDIDKYATNPNEENRINFLSKLPFYEYIKEDELLIIDAAKKEGMRIICLDNLDPKRTIERDEYMNIKIDEVLRDGEKIAAFLGAAHVSWSKESAFPWWGDEKINGATVLHVIKPLGRYLIDSYGKDAVGLVDLTGCYDPYIYTCIKKE